MNDNLKTTDDPCDTSWTWEKHFKWSLVVSLVFHLIAVIFSEGHHKLDEYFAILVATANKLGLMGDEFLHPVEIPNKIRPWLQPYFYKILLWPFTAAGLENPFILTGLMRFFSMLPAFAAHAGLAFFSRKFFTDFKSQIICLWSFALFWYLPFFHARTTSENMSVWFFLAGLIIILKYIPQKSIIFETAALKEQFSIPVLWSIICGFSLGLSFTARYQMSVMIGMLALWVIFIAKLNLKSVGLIIIGGLLSLAFCGYLDTLGYGEPTLAVWNYWHFNIIEGAAASMGTDPWYKYFEKTLLKGIPPFSLLILFAAGWSLIKQPKHLLTWLIWPFVIVHSMIAHKELRFIFAAGVFIPIIFSYLVAKFSLDKKWWIKALVAQNLIALVIASFKPAYSGLSLFKSLHEHNVQKLYTLGDHPRIFDFYFPGRRANLERVISATGVQGFLLTSRFSEFEEVANFCEPLHSSYPPEIFAQIPEKYKRRSKFLTLFKCD